MGPILHHIVPLVINSLEGGQTHVHAYIHTHIRTHTHKHTHIPMSHTKAILAKPVVCAS